jgi:hypothetical protein
VLSYHATNFDPAFRNQVSGLSQQLFHSGDQRGRAQTHAYGLIYQSMQAQAQTLAYIDTYMVLAIGAGIMFLLAFIVARTTRTRAERLPWASKVGCGQACVSKRAPQSFGGRFMIKVLTIEREYGSGGATSPGNWPSGWAGSCGTSC